MGTAHGVGQRLIRAALEVGGCLLILSTIILAQTGGKSSKPVPMGEALSEVENRINRAASAAATLQKAAPLLGQAQSMLSQGERSEALDFYLEARSLLENAPPSITTAALLRSYSSDLDHIISSLTPGGPTAGTLLPAPLIQDDSQGDIKQYLAYYQGRGRSALELGWKRMDTNQPALEAILRERDLPPELVYLGIPESGFNRWALSPKKARGIWQFIPTTAARYGLAQTNDMDERTDPIKSTIAAAAYLKDLYASFGDWNLALAAYNAGEGRIQSVMARTGVRDFWKMRRLGLLPRETANYVPTVLAAISISRNPGKFGFFRHTPQSGPDSKLKNNIVFASPFPPGAITSR
ncbi:MAG: transglycosylase SLT domain-containing protein [Acidobacteriia bacterium]|nr:transglycosylase SLT domain-containing protein [Terriglobia bacterium]